MEFFKHPSMIRSALRTMRCICLGLLIVASTPILAADGSLTREQAISVALDQVGGASKVLGVRKLKSESGLEFFAVKLMVNGRVKVVRIPANNGGS